MRKVICGGIEKNVAITGFRKKNLKIDTRDISNDVCNVNEACHNFKLKKLKSEYRFTSSFDQLTWKRIDICEKCYDVLLANRRDKGCK